MLGPSEEWLEGHKDGPFVATYETIGPHHQYLAPEKRYGREEFDEEDTVNRYLNSVRNQDFFLKNLFDQYKRLGLYEDTVFVLYGDHGEAFGEHGRFQHDNVPYEEGVKIPLLVHDTTRRFENGERVEAPVSQLDLLPTVVDLLGYEIEGGRTRAARSSARCPRSALSCSAAGTRAVAWPASIRRRSTSTTSATIPTRSSISPKTQTSAGTSPGSDPKRRRGGDGSSSNGGRR